LGIGDSLQVELAIGALQMALKGRNWKAGELIHHSDQGVQDASLEYTQILKQREILISMSRRGNPYDNARAERFVRTLKEEVCRVPQASIHRHDARVPSTKIE
jgi:putative transposase